MTDTALRSLAHHSPTHVGRYRLLGRLGGGATSVVYDAIDEATGEPAAIKVLATEMEDEPEARARFVREAKVTADLPHPNIVRILDAGDADGRAYIAMERLDGVSLRDYVTPGAGVPLDISVALTLQLLDGLQAAHDHGVVHRDIKPGNLFVEQTGRLKILDFGLARLKASTLTASGQIVGTPDFMSPEQAEGRQVDPRADQFSAAAVSYFLLTGRAPFARANLGATLQALLNEPPVPIKESEAPPAVSRVLYKALAKRPDDRYISCSSMQADFQNVLDVRGDAAAPAHVAASVGVARL